MATVALQTEYAYRYLRRKYAEDMAGLRALADQVFADVNTQTVITATGMDGGSASATINSFPREVLGAAIERVLAELDPDYTATPAMAVAHVVRHE